MRLVLIVSLMASMACDGGTMTTTDGGADDAPPVMGRAVLADAFCGDLAGIVCEANDSCCGGLSPAVAEDETPVTCRTRQLDACRVSLEPFLRDPRTAYVPERGGAYLDSLRVNAESCFAEPPSMAALFDVFAGTGVEEADCTPSDVNDDALMRISQSSCADGLVCHLYRRSDGRARGVCEPREDDACSHRFDCGAGQWCNLPADWEPGRWGECQPLKASGWDCSDDQECQSRFCDRLGTCAEPLPGRYCSARDYEQTVLSDRPLGYWRLGDVGSGSARDLAGLALDGTYVDATPGEGALAADFDGALVVDGTRGSVELPELSSWMDGNSLTVEVWFRRDEASATGPLLEFWADDEPGVRVWNHNTADRVHVNMRDRDGTSHAITSDEGLVAAGAWTHVVATYDGSAMRLFVNGEQIGEPLAESFRPDVDGILHVGMRPEDERRIIGAIDEVAVYGRALSASRVRSHATIGREGPLAQTFPMFDWLR